MCAYTCFQTLGAEFVVKTVRIPESDNLAVELYLFDTSGHPIYKELRPTYVRSMHRRTDNDSSLGERMHGWRAT